MIYLVICDSTTYEAFYDHQNAIDRVNHLNSKRTVFQRIFGFKWAVKKMLIQ